MISHKSGTQWLKDREVRWRRVRSTSYTWRRREVRVFWFSLQIDDNGLSVVWHQNHCNSFLVWTSKLRSTIWWFVSQNHCYGFLVCASKPSGRMFVGLSLTIDEGMKTVWGHASISGSLLHREASQARVSQFYLKTSRAATTGGARRIKLSFIGCNFPFNP
jgi:hypothetical protein